MVISNLFYGRRRLRNTLMPDSLVRSIEAAIHWLTQNGGLVISVSFDAVLKPQSGSTWFLSFHHGPASSGDSGTLSGSPGSWASFTLSATRFCHLCWYHRLVVTTRYIIFERLCFLWGLDISIEVGSTTKVPSYRRRPFNYSTISLPPCINYLLLGWIRKEDMRVMTSLLHIAFRNIGL